ncbi:MAG: zinc-finger domain-containing protein [Fimbriimonadia bacterium]|nr:zinc-finger domain-containing protein [Fimbriimonadia bacterium]
MIARIARLLRDYCANCAINQSFKTDTSPPRSPE